nr:TonB-dependent receptor [Helicobacter muridarum]
MNYDFGKFGGYIREEIKAGIYRGNPNVPNSATKARGELYDPYYLTHIGGYYQVNDNLRLNMAVYNLFNFNFIDFMPYTGSNNMTAYANVFNYIRESRRYYLSVVMDF